MSREDWTEWGQPWLVVEAVRWLEGWLKGGMVAFEWGAGGSTVWLAQRVKHLASVEHNPEWRIAVETALNRRGLENVRLIPRPATPPDFKAYAEAIRYARAPFDFILIDGADGFDGGATGSRLACAHEAVDRIAPGGVIVLDNAGAKSNLTARDFLSGHATQSLAFVGYVNQPPGVEPGQTETRIFLG